MAYYNYIREQIGMPSMNEEEVTFSHMASKGEVIERLIPEALREAARYADIPGLYRERFMPMIRPTDHVHDFLHMAKRAGLKLALCTNRTHSVSQELRDFCMESFFDPVMTASRAKPKPDPEGLELILLEWDIAPQDAIFIGDSIVDQQAALGAAVPFWSFQNPEIAACIHVAGFGQLLEIFRPLLDNA